MTNQWRDRTPDIVAVHIRPGRTISVRANEVFMLRKDGQLMDIVSEGRSQIRSTVGFLSRLDPDDEVAVITFNDNVVTLSEPDTVRNVVEGLSRRVRTLIADGSTALHSAVCRAAELAEELQAEDEKQGETRLYGIVLVSDGDDTTGQPTEQQMFTRCLPDNAEADGFKIFPIAFGNDANNALLSRIALATGGRVFTADPESISNVYFTISAEQ